MRYRDKAAFSLTTIRLRVFTALIFLLIFSFPASSEASAQAKAGRTGTENLLRQNPTLTLYSAQPNGVPEFVSGELSEPVNSNDFVGATLDFFETHKSEYRMTNPAEELRVKRIKGGVPGMTHIWFDQYFQGVRVVGGELVAHFNGSGRLKTVNGIYKPGIEVDPTPVLTLDMATEAATADWLIRSGESGTVNASELVILLSQEQYHLCWRLTLLPENSLGVWEYFIDAQNGAVVKKANRVIFECSNADVATGTGTLGTTAYDHIDVNTIGPDDKNELRDCSRQSGWGTHDGVDHDGNMPSGNYIATYDGAGVTDWALFPGTIVTHPDLNWDDVSNQGLYVDAHYYTGLVYDWLDHEFAFTGSSGTAYDGQDSFDDNGSTMRISPNSDIKVLIDGSYQVPHNNSGWIYEPGVISQVIIWIPNGGRRSLAACPDVVAHEWAHGVTSFTSDLAYGRESGALSEAFSDMMGATFEDYLERNGVIDPGAANWQFGENSFPWGGQIRDMDNPTVSGDPDYYHGTNWVPCEDCIPPENDNCGVHTNCTVGGKWFQLLSDGGTHPTSSVHVDGIGILNAARIAYLANTQGYWVSETNYFNAAIATLEVADEVDPAGAAGTYRQSVYDAWRAVGVFADRAIILIDRSASMVATLTDGATGSRLDRARERAKQDVGLLFDRNPNIQIAVMSFKASGPLGPCYEMTSEIRTYLVDGNDFSNNETGIKDVIDEITVPEGCSPLAEAMGYAANLNAYTSSTSPDYAVELYVYTDGEENASEHDDTWLYMTNVEYNCGTLLGPDFPDISPNHWFHECDPNIFGDVAYQCSDYQRCFASWLSGLKVITTRYFGKIIDKAGQTAETGSTENHIDETSSVDRYEAGNGENKSSGSLPEDFSFLKAVSEMSGGHFSFLRDYPYPWVKIEKIENVLQGHFQDVSITIGNNDLAIGGFDFLIAYDAAVITPVDVVPGQLLEDCGWEYFTFRYGVDGNCGDACPSGLIRIIALAETTNGANHPSCFGPPFLDFDPHELARISFYISNDRTYQCQYVPIYFFWGDCADNSISNTTGDTLFVDLRIFDFEGNPVWKEDDDILFPEESRIPFVGAPDFCLEGDKETPVRWIEFQNGGIDVICSDSIDLRGDINCDGVPWTIADAVAFVRCLMNPALCDEAAIAASDCNADGIPFSIADLVYLIRVIIGDAPPLPKTVPERGVVNVNLQVNHSAAAVSVNSEVDIGGGYFELDHTGYDIGEPRLINGASDMTLEYSDADGVLRVLVYSMKEGRKITAGTEHIFAVPISGEGTIALSDAELSDYFGNMLTTRIDAKPVLPAKYAMHQNYPNPFNATTTIMYELPVNTHVKIDVFNALGQKVATLIDREEEAGIHSVAWDGADQSGSTVASGVYIYRISTAEFTAEKKMIVMK